MFRNSLAFAFTLALALPVMGEGFTFVQLSDPQLGMGGYEKDVANFKLAVEEINALKPDFVLICGDLTEDTLNARQTVDYLEIAEGFQMPVYHIAGNHDVLNNPNTMTLRYFRKNYGPDYQVINHKGMRFLTVNTSLWKTPTAEETDKQDAWLQEQLADAKSRNMTVVVAGHYAPFVGAVDEEEAYFNLPVETRKKLLTKFEENGVKAYLSGHSHQNILNSHNGIEYVTNASTSRNFDKAPYGYRVWQVAEDGSLKHEYVALKNPVLTEQ